MLVVAEENVEAIVETYAGLGGGGADGGGVYFTNAVTEIVAGQDSRIDRKLQHEGPRAYHVAAMSVQLAVSATFVCARRHARGAACRATTSASP